ncbi:DNA mismatch repair protein, partial [Dimargaris verticillata]
MAIRLLDAETHSRLRATVAVVSLDQAVAELVENAIDAGADKIKVGIRIDDGYIQVCDNGKGIASADAPLLGTRYALASLSRVSVVEIRTRCKQTASGFIVMIKDEQVLDQQPLNDPLTYSYGTSTRLHGLFAQ